MYTAIIVEPREHPALEFVLNNFVSNLSDEWNIIVFHGNKNIDFLKKIIENNLHTRISLINLQVDNLTINDYNNLFMKSTILYDNIPTETFLVFQTDTIIFEKHKHLINDFLKKTLSNLTDLPSFTNHSLSFNRANIYLSGTIFFFLIKSLDDLQPLE